MIKKIINIFVRKPFDIVEELVYGTSNDKKILSPVPENNHVEIEDGQQSHFEAKEQTESFFPELETLHLPDQDFSDITPPITPVGEQENHVENGTTIRKMNEILIQIEYEKYLNDLDMKDLRAVDTKLFLLIGLLPAYFGILGLFDNIVDLFVGIVYSGCIWAMLLRIHVSKGYKEKNKMINQRKENIIMLYKEIMNLNHVNG